MPFKQISFLLHMFRALYKFQDLIQNMNQMSFWYAFSGSNQNAMVDTDLDLTQS